MTTVSIRMSDDMKKELDQMCGDIGISISAFFMIYAKKAIREKAIPFVLSANEDKFYSKSNMQSIAEAEEQVMRGDVVVKSLEELERMTNG